jgi:AbrB family looped-hinge helix DNA binding protein
MLMEVIVMHSTVTAKGQVTIPKSIRDAIGIIPNDRVAFIRKGELVYIQALKTIKSFRGAVKKKASASFESERAQAKAAVAERVKKENK